MHIFCLLEASDDYYKISNTASNMLSCVWLKFCRPFQANAGDASLSSWYNTDSLLWCAVADGFSLRELYRDTSSPAFAQSSRAQEIIDSLQHQLKQLSEERAVKLSATLLSLCECRPGSELAQQLSLLQVCKFCVLCFFVSLTGKYSVLRALQ